MLLQLSYIGLTLIMCIILVMIGFIAINKTFDQSKRSRKKILIVGGLILWNVYIYLMASSGFIQDFSFPPKFALTLIFPAFIFTGIFIYTNRKSEWIQAIPKSWLFYFQSFRILVEIIFVMSVAAGMLHVEATIEGYNFDMAYAFTILIVGLLVFKHKLLNTNILIWWNYLGLLVLASVIFVFITTIYAPQLYGGTNALMPIEGLTYPYVLVAGFLMPVAVFVHVLSIAQLKNT